MSRWKKVQDDVRVKRARPEISCLFCFSSMLFILFSVFLCVMSSADVDKLDDQLFRVSMKMEH